MSSLNDPGGSTIATVERKQGVDTWSFGMFLCIRDGSPNAILHGVVPHETLGTGFEEAGAVMHEFTFSSGDVGTTSAAGFPPTTAPATVPLEGYILDVQCSTPGPDRVAELLVGLTTTSEDGGGWLGADLSYSVGDQDYILEINNSMLICGDAVEEGCD